MNSERGRSSRRRRRCLSIVLSIALIASLPLSSSVFAGSVHRAQDVADEAPSYRVLVTGDAVYGAVLTAEVESSAVQEDRGDPTWIWKRNGEPVDNATSQQYRLGSDDTGARISAAVSFSNDPDASFTSDETDAVARRRITITPTTGQEKYYGQADPTQLTFDASGALQDETPGFTGALIREAGEKTGQYRIRLGNLRLADNMESGFLTANYTLYFSGDRIFFTIKSYNADGQGAAISQPNGLDGWYIKTKRTQPEGGAEGGPVDGSPGEEDADEDNAEDPFADDPDEEIPDDPITLTAPEGYLISTSGAFGVANSWEQSLVLDDKDGANKVASYYLKNAETGAISGQKIVRYKVDKTAPAVQVKYRNDFVDFLNTIRPERFFNRSKGKLDIRLKGEDALSGLAKVEYYLADEEINPNDLEPEDWTKSVEESGATVNSPGIYTLHVRATDLAGNESFFADGIVLYYDSMPGETRALTFTKTDTTDRFFDIFLLYGNTIQDISNGDSILRQWDGDPYEYHGGGDGSGDEDGDAGDGDTDAGDGDTDAGDGEDTDGGDSSMADEYDYSVDIEEVTLKASYLDSLPGGVYTLMVSYNPCGETYSDGGGVSEPPNPTPIKLTVKSLKQDALSITELEDSYIYGDPDIHPAVEGGTVESGVTFTVSDENVLRVTEEGALAIKGAGTVTLTAIKAGDFNYADVTAEAKITVAPRDVDCVSIEVTGVRNYTGGQLTPAINVTDGAILITENDYTVEYGENTRVGTGGGIVTIIGKGNYTGAKTTSFDIVKTEMNQTNASITLEANTFTWNGGGFTPAVKSVTVNGCLVDPAEYTVHYENNVDVGTAKVTVAAKPQGGYTGSANVPFEIRAKAPEPAPAPPILEEPAEVKPDAKPEAKPPVKVVIPKFTVRFNVNGGKALKAALRVKKIQKGKIIGKMPVPKRAKYSFKGWYTKKKGGKKVTAKMKITKPITLYARWKKK